MSKASFLLTAALGLGMAAIGRAEDSGKAGAPAACKACVTVKTCSRVSACEAFRHRFCDWLTYQPLSHPGPCACQLHRAHCCQPPLYAYFFCNSASAPTSCGTGVVIFEVPEASCACAPKKPLISKTPDKAVQTTSTTETKTKQ
jgi:hypothetical protein